MLLTVLISTPDWNTYNREVHPWIHGADWEYDIKKLKEDCDPVIVGRYMAAYMASDTKTAENIFQQYSCGECLFTVKNLAHSK
jgi:hypothetical protein